MNLANSFRSVTAIVTTAETPRCSRSELENISTDKVQRNVLRERARAL
jgi:hypothetical protein